MTTTTETNAKTDLLCKFSTSGPTKMKPLTESGSCRYSLSHVVVVPAKGTDNVLLVACDGKQLTVKEAEGSSDGIFYIPGEALDSSSKKGVCADLNGEWKVTDLSSRKTAVFDSVRNGAGRYPNVAKVFKPIQDDSLMVTIDVNMLKKIADVISADGKVTMAFDRPAESDTSGDIGVGGIRLHGSEGVSIQMPMSGSERESVTEEFNAIFYRLKDNWNNKEIVERYSSTC